MCEIDHIHLEGDPGNPEAAGACMSPDGKKVYWIETTTDPAELRATDIVTKAETVFATGQPIVSTPGSLFTCGGIESGPDGSIYGIEFNNTTNANVIVKYVEGGSGASATLALPHPPGYSGQTGNQVYSTISYVPGLGKIVVPRWVDLAGTDYRLQVFLVEPDLSGSELIADFGGFPSSGGGRAASHIIRSTGSEFWIVGSRFRYTRIAYYDGDGVITGPITSSGTSALTANYTAWTPCDGKSMIIEGLASGSFVNLFKVYKDLSFEQIFSDDPCYIRNGNQLVSHSLSVRGVGMGHVHSFFTLIDYLNSHSSLARWLTFKCAVPVTGLRQKQRDDRLNTPRARGQHNGPSSRQYSPRSSSLNSYR